MILKIQGFHTFLICAKYIDIATDHEYSSANTAKKIIQKAFKKIRNGMEELI